MFRLVAVVVLGIVSSSAVVAGSPSANVSRLRQLRFSPNGQYVLAQDDSTITVLTAEPLHTLFRIPANNTPSGGVSLAQFTPDSQQAVFVRSTVLSRKPPDFPIATSEQVERWSISTRERISSRAIDAHCGTEGLGLSPDGRVLVCVDTEGTLSLFDVTSGRALVVRRKFGSTGNYYGLLDPSSALLEFSPDGHYFVAFPCDLTGSFAWDLRQNRNAVLTGKLKDVNFFYFAFLSSDRVAISDVKFLSDLYNRVTGIDEATIDATVAAFPSGKILSMFKIPPGRLFPAADPGFVIVRPLSPPFPLPPPCGWYLTTEHGKPGPAGAIDVRSGQAIVGETPALDVFGAYYVMAQPTGDVGLYERGKGLLSTVSLEAH